MMANPWFLCHSLTLAPLTGQHLPPTFSHTCVFHLCTTLSMYRHPYPDLTWIHLHNYFPLKTALITARLTLRQLFMAHSIQTACASHPHPPPPPPSIFWAFVFFFLNVANAPRWGQHIYTNPHRGGLGIRGQIPNPWDKIKILFND